MNESPTILIVDELFEDTVRLLGHFSRLLLVPGSPVQRDWALPM